MGRRRSILRDFLRSMGQASLSRAARLERTLRAATRIRSKLIILHTLFSVLLAVILLLALRAPIEDLIRREEERECVLAVSLLAENPARAGDLGVEGIEAFATADASSVGRGLAEEARSSPGEARSRARGAGAPVAVIYDDGAGRFLVARARSPVAQAAADRLYLIVTLSILGVYGLIALTFVLFVLPTQVYLPIDRLRRADEAVQRGERSRELIPEHAIPSDELGDIMRSRNGSILKLRAQEQRLEQALQEVEQVANELRRKNHLLETARRNLQDQDRLASLGMMSAGIAHELNTPLAVLKGSVERLREHGSTPPDPERVALMLRVVSRLERLSESLLDFARARSTPREEVDLASVVREAWTLVRLDREAAGVRLVDGLGPAARVFGDEDRLTQVFVNLLRNAVDAMEGSGTLEVVAEARVREGRRWVSVTIRDTGPGIDPAMLSQVFEPFATTRLDARGTGLGLAVAEGIVREHGGVMLARNRDQPARGAEFEVMLPADRPPERGEEPPTSTGERASAYLDAGGGI